MPLLTSVAPISYRRDEIEISSEPFLAHISMTFAAKICGRLSGSVLDIGCGEGAAIKYLDQIGVTGYIGIDPDAETLAKAQTANPGRDFRLGSIANLTEIVPEVCDAFIACCSLHYVPREHIRPSLRNIRTVLARGAIGCIIVPNGEGSFVMTREQIPHLQADSWRFEMWTQGSLAPKLRGAGFKIRETSLFNPWSLFVVVEAD